MRKNTAYNNFTGGEWSPFLDARADLAKYDAACITMQNFRPLPWGGASLRPGLEFIGLAKSADAPSRLIPFNYSTALSYVIEIGNLYLRFWNSNGTPVIVAPLSALAPLWTLGDYGPGTYVTDALSGAVYYTSSGAPGSTETPSIIVGPNPWALQNSYEIISPFTTAQLFGIQFKQLNAQVRMVHPIQPPQTLTYTAATSWTIGATQFKYPVLMDQNAVQSLTLSVASIVTGASTTLTAAAPAWVSAGTYYPPNTAVSNGGNIYTANVANTSGATFAGDLALGYWKLFSMFNAAHVGAYWELQHLRPSASEILDLDNQSIGVTVYSGNIEMEGDWTFTTSQFWSGEVQVQRSVDNGATWVVIRDFSASSDQNYSTSGTENPPNIGYPPVLYRIAYTMATTPFDSSIWVGSAPSQYAYANAALESQDAYVAGLVLVTAFTNATTVTATIILPPQSTDATYLWSEGAFSNYRGFPQAISFYEQRILYAGTAARPNTIWGSVSADFDNFQYSSDDDGALAFQPAVTQQNQAVWLASLLRVHMGTTGEEIIMASGNLDEPLTPSNVTMRAQSYYGSTPLQPLLLQNSILFVERNGLRVREMRELSPYIVPTDFVAPDLTLMSEHITQGGIVCMDFGRLPDPLAYFVRGDGVLPVMTYNREQNITAWARYVTAGSFESVCCIYGSPADEVWVSVNRPGIGRTIESFTTDPAENPSLTFNLLLDCAQQFNFFPTKVSQVTGLTWLASQTVTAVVDGAEYAGLTVSSEGVLDLPTNVSGIVINVGLPYVGLLSPMKPVLQDQEGTSQGRKLRVMEVVLRVRNSVSVEWSGGPNPTTWQEFQFRSPGDVTGSMTPLSSTTQDGGSNPNGIADWPLPGPWPDGNSFEGQINLMQKHPFPLTVLGVFTKFDGF